MAPIHPTIYPSLYLLSGCVESSGVMKPKPLVTLNHLTTPVAMERDAADEDISVVARAAERSNREDMIGDESLVEDDI